MQPTLQKRIWTAWVGGRAACPSPSDRRFEKEDGSFHMDSEISTNNLSWVKGYGDVLGPMEKVSVLFAEKPCGAKTAERRCRNALHVLMTQASDFRYWGRGTWTEFAHELTRRATTTLQRDF
jgi:hypothetical protein